jgi:hypothetical protein
VQYDRPLSWHVRRVGRTSLQENPERPRLASKSNISLREKIGGLLQPSEMTRRQSNSGSSTKVYNYIRVP